MVKIVAISDTHNQHDQLTIPECDILTVSGDFSGKGTVPETASFINWLADQDQAKHKVFISGNHDYLAQKDRNLFNSFLSRDVHYLQDSYVILEDLKIYGLPWTPFFHDWAFNALEMRKTSDGSMGHDYMGGPGKLAAPDRDHPLMFEVCQKIPEDTHIILAHGPPRLDHIDRLGGRGLAVGSIPLKKRIDSLKELKAGFYGHIHTAQRQSVHNGVTHYNVSICNEMYEPVQPITVVNL